ncbi:alpha/beta-Hydrolases superfamily protein [Carex rostrata]
MTASASAVVSFVASRRINVLTASLPQSSLSLSPRRRNYASLLNVPRDASKLFCAQVKVSDEDEACELVNGHDLIIGEGEDTIHAYLLTAVKNNNGAGVLLLSDIFGFEDSSTRDFAYRVACNGFNVLVPDLFRGNPWGKDRPKSDFDEWIQAQSPLRVSKDIDLCTKWLIDEFKSAGISEKFGLIGFCFGGGRLIETLARDTNSNFLTGICFYGTRMDPSWSNQIQVPVLFISGDNDPLCPVNVLEEMERNIKGTKLVVYSGRGHGFAHRPESQEEDKDAEDAFGVARHWLQEKLLASAVQSVV